jgi:SAF domain
VLQLAANVRAGEQIVATDLRVVEVELDDTVPVVPADRLASIVGQYASVYIPAGTLLVDVLVRPDPLVAPGRSVVAVEIRPTQVPYGLLERSRVQIVVVGDGDAPAFVTEGRVVSVIGSDAEGSEVGSMSVEVAAADAAVIAGADDDVRIVLLDPGVDPVEQAPVVSVPVSAPVSLPATVPPTAPLVTAGAAGSPTTAAAPTITLAPTTLAPTTLAPTTIATTAAPALVAPATTVAGAPTP